MIFYFPQFFGGKYSMREAVSIVFKHRNHWGWGLVRINVSAPKWVVFRCLQDFRLLGLWKRSLLLCQVSSIFQWKMAPSNMDQYLWPLCYKALSPTAATLRRYPSMISAIRSAELSGSFSGDSGDSDMVRCSYRITWLWWQILDDFWDFDRFWSREEVGSLKISTYSQRVA